LKHFVLMPWRCPSCSNVIAHDTDARTPRVGVRYRCHVCRLGLHYDSATEKLIVATDNDDSPQRDQKDSRQK